MKLFKPFVQILAMTAVLGWGGCSEKEVAPITTISFLPIPGGQELSGVVHLHVDAIAADQVRYQVGNEVLSIRETPPFDYRWNTRNTPNGIHLLSAVAIGEASNARDEMEVIVNNVGAGADTLIVIQPQQATLELGDSLRFSALVLGRTDREVEWIVLGGDEDGTVDDAGLYIAPLELPSPPKAALLVRSRAENRLSTTADISLQPRR
jgi:hypothetical protein